jgi:hypothetical protein
VLGRTRPTRSIMGARQLSATALPYWQERPQEATGASGGQASDAATFGKVPLRPPRRLRVCCGTARRSTDRSPPGGTKPQHAHSTSPRSRFTTPSPLSPRPKPRGIARPAGLSFVFISGRARRLLRRPILNLPVIARQCGLGTLDGCWGELTRERCHAGVRPGIY